MFKAGNGCFVGFKTIAQTDSVNGQSTDRTNGNTVIASDTIFFRSVNTGRKIL
jgi:hypothetical protein